MGISGIGGPRFGPEPYRPEDSLNQELQKCFHALEYLAWWAGNKEQAPVGKFDDLINALKTVEDNPRMPIQVREDAKNLIHYLETETKQGSLGPGYRTITTGQVEHINDMIQEMKQILTQ